MTLLGRRAAQKVKGRTAAASSSAPARRRGTAVGAERVLQELAWVCCLPFVAVSWTLFRVPHSFPSPFCDDFIISRALVSAGRSSGHTDPGK